MELELEEQHRGLLSERQLDEQLDDCDHFDGLLQEEQEDVDLMLEELLQLEQEEGSFEQLEYEQLELLLEADVQDFEDEELKDDLLLLLMLEQELLLDVDLVEFDEDDKLDDLELQLGL